MKNRVIVSNQAMCLKCHDKPWSGSVHDYRSCKCGAVAVDGGTEYLRRAGNGGDYMDMSIVMDEETIDACLAEMTRMKDAGRNDRGVLYGILRVLRDSNVELNKK